MYYFSFLALSSVCLSFLLSGVVAKQKQESKANQPTKKAQNAKDRECKEPLKKKRKLKTIREVLSRLSSINVPFSLPLPPRTNHAKNQKEKEETMRCDCSCCKSELPSHQANSSFANTHSSRPASKHQSGARGHRCVLLLPEKGACSRVLPSKKDDCNS